MPLKQHDQLKAEAAKRHATVSEVIREIIENKYSGATNRRHVAAASNAGEWLLGQAEWAKKRQSRGPADLASHVDDYLYAGKK